MVSWGFRKWYDDVIVKLYNNVIVKWYNGVIVKGYDGVICKCVAWSYRKWVWWCNNRIRCGVMLKVFAVSYK